MRRFLHALRSSIYKTRLEREMEEEIAFHLEIDQREEGHRLLTEGVADPAAVDVKQVHRRRDRTHAGMADDQLGAGQRTAVGGEKADAAEA